MLEDSSVDLFNRVLFNRAFPQYMMNIAANVRAIDTVKGELLSEVARLYRTLADNWDDGGYDEVLEELASINAMGYILARRLGLNERLVDDKMLALLSEGVRCHHELEEEFSDMSSLAEYIKNR